MEDLTATAIVIVIVAVIAKRAAGAIFDFARGTLAASFADRTRLGAYLAVAAGAVVPLALAPTHPVVGPLGLVGAGAYLLMFSALVAGGVSRWSRRPGSDDGTF